MDGRPIFLEPIALYYYPFNPTYEETMMSFPKIDTYGVYIYPSDMHSRRMSEGEPKK